MMRTISAAAVWMRDVTLCRGSRSALYAVRFGADGPIKIGRSRNVRPRIKELKYDPRSLGRQAELLAVCEGIGPRERWVHERLDRSRLTPGDWQCEWFHQTPAVLAIVEEMATGGPARIEALIAGWTTKAKRGELVEAA